VWQESARLYNRILDLLKKEFPLSSTFRSQIDAAGLSVSNNIAEGFEKLTTGELITFLGNAKGSAGEVRSMVAVVFNRPELKPFARDLLAIRTLAESCSRQLKGGLIPSRTRL
jgi:four helix bundle protein